MSTVTIVPKGQSATLRGKNMVSRAMIGLGWDLNAGQSAYDLDLDVSAVARNSSGIAVACAYYGDTNPVPYLSHSGDNLTGAGEGDDEQLHIDFSAIPADVARVDFYVNIYDAQQRGQMFGMVESGFCRVVNEDSGVELIKTLLESVDFNAVGLHVASFVRNGPTWDFVSVQKTDKAYVNLEAFVNTPIV